MDLKDKVVLITGASKGIGKITSIAMAKKQAKLAIAARTSHLLDETAKEIEKAGSSVFTYAGDLTQENQLDQFIKSAVAHFGKIDILVNNAGIGHFGKIGELSIDKWDEMFNLNIRSVFLITQKALPFLRKQGESVIVNVASLAGKNFFVGGGGYAATKHALVGFSRCLMLEERGNGVRVLTLCPGSVDTHFFDGRENEDEIRKKRILHAEDVAQTIIGMIELPQHALVSEIDIRPTNP